MTDLPELLDCKRLQAELGDVPRGVAEAVMRHVPKVRIGRRVFVKRPDVAAYLDAQTVGADGFREAS